jgi:hypothetical protein
MSQQNILFFSQSCQHSKKLLAKIINTPLYNGLQKVSIDDPQTRARLPKWVTCVPLIYLANPHPSFKNPLYNNELWAWIEQQILQPQAPQQTPQQFQQQLQQPPNQSQQQPSQLQQQQQQFDGFQPYNFSEMKGGIASDNYSVFNKDDNNNSALDSFFPHTYETIGNMSQSMAPFNNNGGGNMNQGPGQGQGQGQARSTLKQEKFDQDFAMKKALRDQDVGVAPQARKMDGVPDNFNQMFEANNRR